MSLPRKDVRAKLDHDMHAALKVLCNVDRVTEAQFIEALLEPVIKARFHAASLIVEKATEAGLAGMLRESQAGGR